MTDLMEHEPIDELARRAVVRLRSETSARPLPVLRLRRRHRWLMPALAAATVVAVVAGLFAIGTNRNEPSVGNEPSDPRWVLTDLPDGWSLTGTTGPNSTSDRIPFRFAVYATDQLPLGPVVAIVPDAFTDLADPATVQHVVVGGKPAVVANGRGMGQRVIDVELTPGHWVGTAANGLDDDMLLAVGAQVSLGSDGLPILSDPATVGVHLVGVGDLFALPAPGSDSAGMATSTYRSADGREWSMSVGPSSEMTRAWWGLRGARRVGDGMFALGPPGSARGLVWERDGLAFDLELSSGAPFDEAAMVDVARSARLASAQQWPAVAAGSNEPHPPTTPAIAETSIAAEPTGSWTDVTVDTSVANIDPFSYRLTFTDRGGTPSTLDVQFIGPSLQCGSVDAQITGGGGSGGGTVCWVVNSDSAPSKPVALRVYGLHGIRYIVGMQNFNGVTFAAYHIDGIDNLRADLVYLDGTIESLF